MNQRPWVALLIVLALSLGSLPAGQAAAPTRDHTFECGTDVPPSGPYHDLLSGWVFDYDCTTGALVPSHELTRACDGSLSGNGYHFGAGACMALHDASSTSYDMTFQLAVIGEVDHIEINTFGVPSNPGVDCGPHADPCELTPELDCETGNACAPGIVRAGPSLLSDGLVTFANTTTTFTSSCLPEHESGGGYRYSGPLETRSGGSRNLIEWGSGSGCP